MKTLLRYLSILPFLFTVKAMAGNESHGGDIVICDGKEPVVLDYYHASLKPFGGSAKVKDLSKFSVDQVTKTIILDMDIGLFGRELLEAYFQIGGIDTWIEADLKEVDDSNEPYFLPKDCRRVQGAVRQGSQVYVDPTYVRLLSPMQQGILVAHEVMLLVANRNGHKTSEGVRNLIRAILLDRPFGSATAEIGARVREIGGKVFPMELLISSSAAGQYTSPHARNGLWFDKLDIQQRVVRARYVNSSNILLPVDPLYFSCRAGSLAPWYRLTISSFLRSLL